MRINVLTPIRKGGPHFIGKQLVEHLNRHGIKARHTHTLTGLVKSMFRADCDIVHSMDIPLFFRLWKKPFILTIHGEFSKQSNRFKAFYPIAIKKADKLLVPSYFLGNKLKLNAEVIHNAVNVEEFKQASHKNKSDINIVTITKFHFKDKADGILKLLKILEAVSKKTSKKINYVVAGGGKYLDSIKKESKNYKINVKFTGFIENPKTILEKSDIFLYYSKHESFGIILLEAMASGLPVVVNKYGPFEEIIDNEKDGFIAKDQKEYEDKVLELVENHTTRRSIGELAQKKVKEKFNWDRKIEEYISMYTKLTRKRL